MRNISTFTATLRNGRFEEVTDQGGPGILENAPARGCAFGDYDNDGDMDIAVNCINAIPQLLRCDSTLHRNWIKIKLVGYEVQPHRHRQPGYRYREKHSRAPKSRWCKWTSCAAAEVISRRTISACISAWIRPAKVDLVEIRWLSGQIDQFKDLEVNQLYVLQEGGKIIKSAPLLPGKVKG